MSQAKNIPLAKIGETEDMAGPVVFLASDAAASCFKGLTKKVPCFVVPNRLAPTYELANRKEQGSERCIVAARSQAFFMQLRKVRR